MTTRTGPDHHTNLKREVHVMAEKDSTTQPWGVGPKTIDKARDRLAVMAAFAYLGKKAFMEGDFDDEGWEEYLKSIDSPFNLDHLREAAFEGLLKMACDTWHEINDPLDAVEGKIIDRTKPPAAREGGE